MATVDWSQCPAVESIPGKRSGALVFRGTRTPVSTVFENLQDMNVDELMEEFGVTREQVESCIAIRSPQRGSASPSPLMLVLFDNGTPRTLARYLIDRHAVTEARARGWEELENGELLNVAEAAGFEVLVTTDKNLPYQQNLVGRKIAIVVLGEGTVEPYQAACSAGCRRSERSDTGQLC